MVERSKDSEGGSAFLRQLADSARALEERKASRERERSENAGGEPPEQARAMKAKAAERAKSMTARLTPLASLGDIEALRQAIAEGAVLSKAADSRRNPAMAAIAKGHSEAAIWLMEQPGWAWADRGKLSLRGDELDEAIHADDVRVLAKIVELRPKLVERLEEDASRRTWSRGPFERALAGAPKCAAWMVQEAARVGVDVAGVARLVANRSATAEQEGLCGALHNALAARDEASAGTILEALRTPIEAPRMLVDKAGAKAPWAGPLGLAALAGPIESDDAWALAWLLARAPKLAGMAIEGSRGLGDRGGSLASKMPAARPIQDRASKARSKARSKAPLATTLPMWAALEGSVECLELLLGVAAFESQFASMQSRPSEFFWEAAYLRVKGVRCMELMESSGFDFAMPAARGASYPTLLMLEHGAKDLGPARWLEAMAKSRPGMFAPDASTGRSPFDDLRACGWIDGEKIGRWESIFDKAAVRAAAPRAGSPRKAKASRRL